MVLFTAGKPFRARKCCSLFFVRSFDSWFRPKRTSQRNGPELYVGLHWQAPSGASIIFGAVMNLPRLRRACRYDYVCILLVQLSTLTSICSTDIVAEFPRNSERTCLALWSTMRSKWSSASELSVHFQGKFTSVFYRCGNSTSSEW